MTQISCEFHYDSAHYLPYVPPGHKCGNLHGHTYRLIVTLEGDVRNDGFVVDFADVKRAVAPLVKALDHRLINDVIPNPTVEVQLEWFWDHLKPTLPQLAKLTIYEGLHNHAALSR